MRTSLVIANWKLNGNADLLKSFAERFHQSELQQHMSVAICPPAVYLKTADVLLNAIGVKVGGQNCSEYEQGAYTGEISAQMLADCGCKYVLIGHSERRALFAESDQVMAGKVQQAQKAGLTPVLCIGETLEQREAGKLEQVIEQQLESACEHVDFENLVIAYEPVWAIGTGQTATPEQAQDVHRLIRNWVARKAPKAAQKIQILYGGSVKADNATELFSQADIDGGLIGGASLDTEQFTAICQAANAI